MKVGNVRPMRHPAPTPTQSFRGDRGFRRGGPIGKTTLQPLTRTDSVWRLLVQGMIEFTRSCRSEGGRNGQRDCPRRSATRLAGLRGAESGSPGPVAGSSDAARREERAYLGRERSPREDRASDRRQRQSHATDSRMEQRLEDAVRTISVVRAMLGVPRDNSMVRLHRRHLGGDDAAKVTEMKQAGRSRRQRAVATRCLLCERGNLRRVRAAWRGIPA